MSKLLQRYINKDVGQRYNKDFVSYFLEYASTNGDQYVRDIVHTVPTMVVDNYHKIASALGDDHVSETKINNTMTHRRSTSNPSFGSARLDDIRGAMIECASKNSRMKNFVIKNFPRKSVPQYCLTKEFEKRILNSPSLCVFIKVDDTGLNVYNSRVYTKSTDIRCIEHAIDCVIDRSGFNLFTFLEKITSIKPITITLLTRSRLEKMNSEKLVLRLLAVWNSPSVKKAILDKDIYIESDAANYIGEIISMHKIAGEKVPWEATKALRLVKP